MRNAHEQAIQNDQLPEALKRPCERIQFHVEGSERNAPELNDGALALCQSHVECDVVPRDKDRVLTGKFKVSLALFRIKMLDHIFVSGGIHTFQPSMSCCKEQPQLRRLRLGYF